MNGEVEAPELAVQGQIEGIDARGIRLVGGGSDRRESIPLCGVWSNSISAWGGARAGVRPGGAMGEVEMSEDGERGRGLAPSRRKLNG